ncbi:hypothetical protein Trydic_g1434 [Trypoxylus dichotomus]
MNAYIKMLLFLSAVVTTINLVTGAVNNTRAFTNFGSQKNVSTVGICEIEVPVVSILPPEQRHTASFIRGNGTNPGYSKIRICCAGYNVAPNSPFHCIPSCPNGCGLGNCTAPNICVCSKAAVLGPDGKCIAICPKGCLNGQCYGGLCNCNHGFTLEPSGRYCIPGCSKNCGPGGQCGANNQCICKPGYKLNQQGVCQMICDSGYKAVGSVCEPQCVGGCLNGECIAPNRCNCYPGYNLERNGTCTPKCSLSQWNVHSTQLLYLQARISAGLSQNIITWNIVHRHKCGNVLNAAKPSPNLCYAITAVR